MLHRATSQCRHLDTINFKTQLYVNTVTSKVAAALHVLAGLYVLQSAKLKLRFLFDSHSSVCPN